MEDYATVFYVFFWKKDYSGDWLLWDFHRKTNQPVSLSSNFLTLQTSLHLKDTDWDYTSRNFIICVRGLGWQKMG